MSKNINKTLAPFAVAVLIIAVWHYGYLGRFDQKAVERIILLPKNGPPPPHNTSTHKYAYEKNVNSLSRQHVNFKPDSIQDNLTIVSAFYDINRVGRPNSEYFKWLRTTFQLNNPFIFFTQAKYKNDILELIPPNRPVLIVILELEHTPYYKDIDRVKQIISIEQYRSRVQHPNRIECTNPSYVLVQFAKFALLEIALKLDTFKSNRYLWMDAGASRFFGDFDLKKPLTGRNIPEGQFLVNLESRAYGDQMFSSKNRDLIWTSSNFIRGTMMGGASSSIGPISKEMGVEWEMMLNASVVNNEQILLNLLLFRRRELFYLYDKHGTAVWNEFLRFLL
jgi:hypothetical protein